MNTAQNIFMAVSLVVLFSLFTVGASIYYRTWEFLKVLGLVIGSMIGILAIVTGLIWLSYVWFA